MVMINDQWADSLTPVVREHFGRGFSRRNPLAPSLFNVTTSDSETEELSGAGAIGIEAWEQYEKDGKTGQADFDQGFKTTFTHKEYPVEVTIKRKLFEDTNWIAIRQIASRMGDSAAVKREKDGASVFNNATSASFLGGDGVALLSDSHPLSPTKLNDTQDNLLALALTKDNLGAARETMMAFTDDNNNLIAATPNVLLVPPELEDTALEIVQSQLDPDSANNTFNPQSGRFQVVTWHELTDGKRWFVIDSNLMRDSLMWFNRSPLTISPKVMDTTIESTWIAYMRYSFGWADWRWVVGSEPS